MVAPGKPEVISLEPEFITPQDGHDKQDCENAAAKRWIAAHPRDPQEPPVTLLGDDLYSAQSRWSEVTSMILKKIELF